MVKSDRAKQCRLRKKLGIVWRPFYLSDLCKNCGQKKDGKGKWLCKKCATAYSKKYKKPLKERKPRNNICSKCEGVRDNYPKSWCKSCTNEYSKARKRKISSLKPKKDKTLCCKCNNKKDVTWSSYCKDCRRNYNKSYRLNENSKKKLKIRIKVNSLIKSRKIIKMPCEKCGNIKTQAHHDDYNKPLDVRWLCHFHHREHHRMVKNNPNEVINDLVTRKKVPGVCIKCNNVLEDKKLSSCRSCRSAYERERRKKKKLIS